MKLTTARTLLFAAPLALVLSVAAPPSGASPLKGSSPKGSGSDFLDRFAKPNNPTPGTDPFGFGPGNPNPAGTGPGDPNFDEVINHLGSPLPLSGVESIPPGGGTAIQKAISAMDQDTVPPVKGTFADVPGFGGGLEAGSAIGLLLYDGDITDLIDLPKTPIGDNWEPSHEPPNSVAAPDEADKFFDSARKRIRWLYVIPVENFNSDIDLSTGTLTPSPHMPTPGTDTIQATPRG